LPNVGGEKQRARQLLALALNSLLDGWWKARKDLKVVIGYYLEMESNVPAMLKDREK